MKQEWYSVERTNGKVKVRCDDLEAMAKVSDSYDRQDIKYKCFKYTKEEI